jgi:hypothetical protein
MTSAFSNRPSGVKHFQAIHHCNVDVSHGLALLRNRHQGRSIMGSEDEAEQSLPRPCRQFDGGSKRKYELASSIVPRGTPFHRKVELEFPPIGSDRSRCHAAAAACSLVQRNSVPSTQAGPADYPIFANQALRNSSSTCRKIPRNQSTKRYSCNNVFPHNLKVGS